MPAQFKRVTKGRAWRYLTAHYAWSRAWRMRARLWCVQDGAASSRSSAAARCHCYSSPPVVSPPETGRQASRSIHSCTTMRTSTRSALLM